MFELKSDLAQARSDILATRDQLQTESRRTTEERTERALRTLNNKLAAAIELKQQAEIQDSYTKRVAVDNIVLRETESPDTVVVRMPGENDTGHAVVDEMRFDEEGQLRQALRVRLLLNPDVLLSGRSIRQAQQRGLQRALRAKHQYVGEFTIRSLLLLDDHFEVKINDPNPKVAHLQPGVYQRGEREFGQRTFVDPDTGATITRRGGGRGSYLIMHLAYLPRNATRTYSWFDAAESAYQEGLRDTAFFDPSDLLRPMAKSILLGAGRD
jgi:hypothetical protein